MNGVIAEYPWPTHSGGAVRVRVPGYDLLVVEQEWEEVAGTGDVSSTVGFPNVSAVTWSTPGVWSTMFASNPARHEVFVSNNHSDPNAVVLVRGGPYPPKAIWPDSPAFVAAGWKGAVQVMSPTHSLVRLSGSEV